MDLPIQIESAQKLLNEQRDNHTFSAQPTHIVDDSHQHFDHNSVADGARFPIPHKYDTFLTYKNVPKHLYVYKYVELGSFALWDLITTSTYTPRRGEGGGGFKTNLDPQTFTAPLV